MIGLDNPLHIALILVVVLVVFGAKRLPEMGKSLGEGMRGFKDSLSGSGPVGPTADQTESTRQLPAPEPAPAPATSDPVQERVPVGPAA